MGTALPSPHTTERIQGAAAGTPLTLGLLLPWNIEAGVGIAGTSGWFLVALVVVTVLSLVSLTRRYAGAAAGQRLALNAPCLTMVVLVAGFAVVQSVQDGGSGATPPGVGPGAWCSLAGALIAVRPGRSSAARVIGLVSVGLAAVAVMFNLYWRLRFVVPDVADPETARQSLVTVVAAVLYGLVALAPVVMAGRWMISESSCARGALSLLGASTLLSGALVWWLPIGRDVDAFHGIAQSTSTAGVGFEGYLAWAAAGALSAVSLSDRVLHSNSARDWRRTVRACLRLIAAWCAGTALLRVVDIASASSLGLPVSVYDGTVMMAFDLTTALMAGWILINGFDRRISRRTLMLLLGAVFALVVTRLVVAVGLAPRVAPLDPRTINAVWGNDLYQQISCTFDVTICVLTLLLLVWALMLRSSSALAEVNPQPTEASPRRPRASSGTARSNGCTSGVSKSLQVVSEGVIR